MARFFAVTLIFLSLIFARGIVAQQAPAAEERSWLLLNGNQIRGVYEPLEGDDAVRRAAAFEDEGDSGGTRREGD